MPNALRRLLLVHDYAGSRGGAELVMQDLRAELRRRGFDARLMASTADPAGDTAPDYRFRGSTGGLRALRETINPDAVRVARKVIREFDPQVVHLGMILTQASPAVLPLFRGRAVVWMPNEFRPVCPKGTRLLPDNRPCTHRVGRACLREGCFRVRGLAPRLLQLALLHHWLDAVSLVVSPSRAFADMLELQGIRVDEVVAHGVPVPPLRKVPVETALLGFAGRLVPEKGIQVLLDALSQLPPRFLAVRLQIAGEGPHRAALERQARELGLAGRVEFLGHVPRETLQHRFESLSVQVVPSLWAEPYGLVTVEAMARGTPVVATAVGATPELIEDGRTGYLVPPNDASALAGALTRALEDPPGREAIARAAWQKAFDDLSLGRMTDQFLALYARLLDR